MDFGHNNYNKNLAKYPWKSCSWNQIQMKFSKNYFVLKINNVEKQLQIRNLKRLIIGKGMYLIM